MPTDFFGRVMVVFNRYGMSMLQGAGVSLKIALVGTLVGCIIGFAVGIVQTIPNERGDNPVKRAVLWVVKLILNAYVEFFRGTPMMAQAMFIYYGLLPMLGINMSMWGAAYFILSINTGAYMAETVRGGILSIDPGQTEGAKAVGMTHVQTMLYVILPQALRNIMPQIGNNLIINIKDSCVLSVIGVTELLYKTKAVCRRSPVHEFRGIYHHHDRIFHHDIHLFQNPALVGKQDGRRGQLRPGHHRYPGAYQRYVPVSGRKG